MHEQLRKEKVVRKDGKVGYQVLQRPNDKNMKVTFDAIEKMHYSDFNSGNENEDFKPSDIVDEDDGNGSDDEILKKFKNDNVDSMTTE
jgi:hypothetical protein